ncbi:type II toxin-antitoxin system RelE/ParE family toxin [Sedimentibacter sp.]|uniref:type II toxin-antitoxin system RelE family toxin n=1 Tax=Sedimentibacter sp. TaxID=1960295 RepID=UPI002899E42D|nr:type II toxin-antitoxin system RelE/ParE family toxin [Sedimentibacter sp.]
MDIVYSKRAKKFLDKQNEETGNRIITAVEKLPAGDVKRLRGLDGFRLRVGTYRIIFDQEE